MSKIQYLREYLTLAETLSYARTAEIMYIAQPALSRHICALEEEMGAKLLIRNTRNVALTEAGERACACFKEMLRLYDNTRLAISSSFEGTLTISSPYYWTQEYTEPFVQKVYSLYPECRVKILACLPHEGYWDMLDDRSDAAICFDLYGSAESTGVGRIPFGSDALCAFVDRDLKLSERDSLMISDMVGCSFVTLGDKSMPGLTDSFRNMLIDGGIQDPDLLIVPIDELDSIGMTIHKTKRIGIMTHGASYQNRTYLKCIPLQGGSYEIPLYLYFKRKNPNPLISRLEQINNHELE